MGMASSGGARINWVTVTLVGGVHLFALLALLPWFFSWSGVALALLGCYVFGTLGINLGYHRLLTHRSFKCPMWLERTLALLGVCCLERSPGSWVATHREHHQHSDLETDPHTPLKTLFWGHMGWVFVDDPQHMSTQVYDRYARDLFRDPFYMRLEKGFYWAQIYAMHAMLFLAAGFAVGLLAPGGSLQEGVRMGLSYLVWGVFVRTVLVWHITWSVNSFAHVWGYRNYETRENSRNNWLVALVSNGEGWHNNHHADQKAAAHGHKWWEFDVTYLTINVLQCCGLAWDVAPVRAQETAAAPATENSVIQ